jgi:hypothetical protein
MIEFRNLGAISQKLITRALGNFGNCFDAIWFTVFFHITQTSKTVLEIPRSSHLSKVSRKVGDHDPSQAAAQEFRSDRSLSERSVMNQSLHRIYNQERLAANNAFNGE